MRNLLRKIRQKWAYSVIGLWTVIREEKSFWGYLFALPILIGIGVWVKLAKVEWAIVMLIFFVVIAIEVINTALEATVDAISFQYNIKVKKIKDIAAGATLTITTGGIICWLLIYIPKIVEAV